MISLDIVPKTELISENINEAVKELSNLQKAD